MKGISFDKAIEEMQNIIKTLESGDLDLVESISLYERGVKLTKYCQNQLDKAKLKIEKINSENTETKDESDGKD